LKIERYYAPPHFEPNYDVHDRDERRLRNARKCRSLTFSAMASCLDGTVVSGHRRLQQKDAAIRAAAGQFRVQ